ncbi:unnamed protein product [Paramecium octaurelia]|uniref:Transmembrane protein n=1 Tax=Paramecium octaurelia TaxID=43137 RepID=A0A8S1XDB5_PAROT|nr:unnamed protein product [Paramecium octaurelia]
MLEQMEKYLSMYICQQDKKISSYEIFDWKNKFYYKSNLIFRIFVLDGDMNSIQIQIIHIALLQADNLIHQKMKTKSLQIIILIYIKFILINPLRLQFYCNSINVPIYSNSFPFELVSYHSNYNLRINIKTFDCQFGEIKNLTNLSCEKCDFSKGLYTLTLNSERCDIKDDLTIINVQNNQLVLRAGFWRPYFDTKAIDFCLNLQENCLGGISQGDREYLQNLTLVLVLQVILVHFVNNVIYITPEEMDNIQQSKGFHAGYVLRGKETSCQFLESLKLILQGNIKTIEQYTKYLPLKILRNSIYMSKNQSGTLIKMLTNYFQIIVSITTFQLQFSVGLNYTLNAVGNPLQTSSYSLDCFLGDLRELQINLQYIRIIWQITLPVLYISLFIGCYFFATLIRKTKFNQSVATTTSIYIYNSKFIIKFFYTSIKF